MKENQEFMKSPVRLHRKQTQSAFSKQSKNIEIIEENAEQEGDMHVVHSPDVIEVGGDSL